jgi:uncharacterized membrane protein
MYGYDQKDNAMQIITLYLATVAIFLILDAVMMLMHMQPLFQRHIGPMLADKIRLAPAAIFYLFYIAGLIYLVSYPALKMGGAIVIPAAIIGAMAYGTYEFTSYAVMKDWHISMVLTDVIWGTCLTAFSAWGGVVIVRILFKGAI